MTESVRTLNSEDSSACWMMRSVTSGHLQLREGGKEGGREGGREGRREREREGRKEGRRERGREKVGGKKGGRDGGSITAYLLVYANSQNLEIEAHTC